MANKRISQFFEFAERNISDPQVFSYHSESRDAHLSSSANSNTLTAFQKTWGAVSLLSIVLITIVRVPHTGLPEPKTPAHAFVKNITRVHSDPSLKSEIPDLQVMAIRQRLYPIPLRKAEQVVFHQEEDLNESWVVLDSVVFIPKVNG